MAADEEPTTNGLTRDKAAPPGSRCETKALEERHSKKGDVEVIEKDEYKPEFTKPYEDYALVTQQYFDKDYKLTKTTLMVNSPQILQVFQDVVRFYPTQPSGFEDSVTLENPFSMLYHYRKEFATYRQKQECDDLTRMHVNLLLDFIQGELGEASSKADRMVTAGFINFKYLWTIYRPGDLLYATKFKHGRLYRMEDAAYRESKVQGPFFEITCSFLDFDGTNVGKAKENIQIYERRSFAGENPSEISSLPVFPREHLKGQDDLEERLMRRGERFLEMKESTTVYYSGLFEYLKLPPWSWWGDPSDRDGIWVPTTSAGRVVIDSKTFTEEFREERVELLQLSAAQKDYLRLTGRHTDDVEIDAKLSPPFAYGFSLEQKVWCKFFIDNIQPVKWTPNPMSSLILPTDQKDVLRALVASHAFPEEAHDESELKGKGLVVLLHGTPGSGKTLTAETAAEYTKKALVRIALSELNDQERLEYNLRTFQRYATTWKAIVLIDEADVFLEARGKSNQAEQNGLVAVFLRNLEYFQGITFLTSNRVGVFDSAIRSRIHLALQYNPPDRHIRRILWQKRLGGIPAEEISQSLATQISDAEMKESETLDLLEKAEMNGREISNAINTACTLARDAGVKLEHHHLQTIQKVWVSFGTTLAQIEAEQK